MGTGSPRLHTTRAALFALVAGVALVVVRPANAETSVTPPLAAPVVTVATTVTTTVTETVAAATTAVAETTAPVAAPAVAPVAQVAPQVPAASVAPAVKPVVEKLDAATTTIKAAEPARTHAPVRLPVSHPSVPHVQPVAVHHVSAKPAKLPKHVSVVRHVAPKRATPHIRHTQTRAAAAPVLRSAAISRATHATATDATSSGAATSGTGGAPVAASARTFGLPAAQPSVGAWPTTEQQPRAQHPLAFERPG
jgi:hypothetical protein